jgi:hypothetical protein
VERPDLAFSPTSPAAARDRYLAQPGVAVLEEQTLGACRLYRVLQRAAPDEPPAPVAIAAVTGGPVLLDQLTLDLAQVGDPLRLVLYWRAETPVAGSYTVFTQLFDPAGTLVAQQDNLPVQGLAPTDAWQPDVVIRDPYTLAIPADATPGSYRLRVGLYDGAGRRPLTLADGSTADHIEIPVEVVADDQR